MKLVIDRTKWLRGEPNSYLLRVTDEKMCCLGFYSLACGLTREQIVDKATPADAALSGAGFNLPDQMDWLFSRRDGPRGGHFTHSSAAHDLMVTNDDRSFDDRIFTPEERETKVAQLFRAHGVEVEFIN